MKLTSNQPKIIVVGSSSIDLVLNTEKIPESNQTVMAQKSESFFGGKGANQAVGTARLGASVYFVGCVGMDPFGQQVMRNLVNEGVNVGFVNESETHGTGTAYVTVAEGKSAIVVVPAANYQLQPKHVRLAEKYFSTADTVLVQLEIPMESVLETYQLAKKYGKRLGIYAAPAHELPQEVIDYASFIVVKSSELGIVFGNESRDEILKKYPNKLIVRDDTNSTVYFDGAEMRYFRNDTNVSGNRMGMGDAFTSGFTIALSHGNEPDDCVKFGNEISLRVAANRGSQDGLPYLNDLDFFN